MRKKLIALLILIMLLCFTGCGSDDGIEGTWYFVNGDTDYKFSSGKIKVAGTSIGNYTVAEDIVHVIIEDAEFDQKLYHTQVDGVGVLVTSIAGDGRVVFCKGSENAENIEEKFTIENDKLNAINAFAQYINYDLLGEWKPSGPVTTSKKIEFVEDGSVITTDTDGTIREFQAVYGNDGYIVTDISIEEETNGNYYPVFSMYVAEVGSTEAPGELTIAKTSSTYSENIVLINGEPYQKVAVEDVPEDDWSYDDSEGYDSEIETPESNAQLSDIAVRFEADRIEGDSLLGTVFTKNNSEEIFEGNVHVYFYGADGKKLGSETIIVDELQPGRESWANVSIDVYNGTPKIDIEFTEVHFTPIEKVSTEVDSDATQNTKDSYYWNFDGVSWYHDITDIVVYTDGTCIVMVKDDTKEDGQFYAAAIWGCGEDYGVDTVRVVDKSGSILSVYP